MLKIRLLRAGAKKRPYYRIVAIDERRQRDGRALEFLGSYDPKHDPAVLKVEIDRIDHWVSQGARLSDTVRSIVNRARREAVAAPTAEAS
jgi:small subunit ribosomal protein S16